ncbi:aldehyde dehydrogenase family protein [Streptomyces sp. NPDC059166]|uniref:aldehyde dehydrogenase family protein n=1 Tax=Streptomyces sp. NPDC059166 TaxID=3346752 RepID=UPI0036A38868
MSFLSELAHQYIDGEWLTGDGEWDIIDFDPRDGEKLCSITVATTAQVDSAYRAAERAQSAWAGAGHSERRAVLEKAALLLDERRDETAELLVAEAGVSRAAAEHEIRATGRLLRAAVRLTDEAVAELLPSLGDGRENRVHRVPVGVVGVIGACDLPLAVTVRTVAPALALGNAAVVKPHQSAPVAGGTLVARILEDAGLPAGLLNVLITDSSEIGDSFIEHPVPKVLSFTGSERVGRRVAAVAAGLFKRTVLDLAGGSALVVLDDADLDQAVRAAVHGRSRFRGRSGEAAAGRVLVDRTVEAEFTRRFTAALSALPTGDAYGRESGGEPSAPVSFDGEDEALRVVNDGPRGLCGAVHTADTERGVRFARRISRGGVFHVNGPVVHDDPAVAFGGETGSGTVRLDGSAARDAFTTRKWISVQHGRTSFPF